MSGWGKPGWGLLPVLSSRLTLTACFCLIGGESTGFHFLGGSGLKVKVLLAQSCLTLCDLMDGSPPGSSVHRISHARILEWVATLSSKGSSQPRD